MKVVLEELEDLENVWVGYIAQNVYFVLKETFTWLALGVSLLQNFDCVLFLILFVDDKPHFAEAALANYFSERVHAGDVPDPFEVIDILPRSAVRRNPQSVRHLGGIGIHLIDFCDLKSSWVKIASFLQVFISVCTLMIFVRSPEVEDLAIPV